MDLGLVARYLVLRRQLRFRELWSPDRLRLHQRDALRELRGHVGLGGSDGGHAAAHHRRLGIIPFDVYAATEAAGIASECEQHAGLHLYEDLVIAEVVDENNDPVPPGVAGAKIFVSVLFSRTQPLIRYELSDSVVPTDRCCPCGRTFGLIAGVQGRREDIIHHPSGDGRTVSIHPNVFHDVLDRVRPGEWQIVQDAGDIRLLVARPGADFDGAAVLAEVARALEASGAEVRGLSWTEVEAIPRTGTGKAPLVRAVAARRFEAGLHEPL